MVARNANNATWYLLRHGADFASGGMEGAFHDPARGVLELLPTQPAEPAQWTPGVAVGLDGEVYRAAPREGAVMVRRCDGSEAPLAIEPGALVEPMGVAVDRRGFLYIADPGARRVVVVAPDECNSVVAVLVEGLRRPVDVAVAPNRKIYVADREAGLVVVFDARFRRCGDFPSRNGAGLPTEAHPVAVMIGPDASIVVVDPGHPRLLRFGADGSPRADTWLTSLLYDLPLDVSELRRLFVEGRAVRACGATPEALHRAGRMLFTDHVGHYAEHGAFLSRALDGGLPGTRWHKVVVDADFPPGTWLRVETFTAAREELLASVSVSPGGRGGPGLVLDASVPDMLIQSAPGRYLRLGLTLGGDGSATPSVRSIRVFYPRVSYLDMLPRVFRRDPEAELFLEHFLGLFEHVLTGVEDRYEEFSRQLDPAAAPREVIDWLASLVDLSFDPSWPLARRRALVESAMELFRTRGTVRGLARYVEIYTGVRPVIVEGFAERPRRPPFLGVPGNVLGCNTRLLPPPRDGTLEDVLVEGHAHRFAVFVFADDARDEKLLHAVVDTIVAANRPAHTDYRVRVVRAEAHVGEMRVGLDFVLGTPEAPATRLGGCPPPQVPPGPVGVLGRDTVLGAPRPGLPRAGEERSRRY